LFTRECLAIDVARMLRFDDVLERLSWLFATRGVPEQFAATTARSIRPAWFETGYGGWT